MLFTVLRVSSVQLGEHFAKCGDPQRLDKVVFLLRSLLTFFLTTHGFFICRMSKILIRRLRGEAGSFLSNKERSAFPDIRMKRSEFTLYLLRARRTLFARLPDSSQLE